MKRTILCRLCGLTCLWWLLAACQTQEPQENPTADHRKTELRLEGPFSAAGLSTPLYLFRRPIGTAGEYILCDRYESVRDGQTLKLPVADLQAYDYRFLIVAQPADARWLALETAAGSSLSSGDAWGDLRMVTATGEAATDGYCGFTDRTGDELLTGGTVRLTLGRIAGQVRFDCFRIGASLADPEAVVSPDVESVLDRIDRIEISYENPTVALRFGPNDVLVPAAVATEPFVQTIRPDLTDFKAALPQPDKGLEIFDASLRGSLRMKGACLLPSDSRLRITMVFSYFDTTPACGNDHDGFHRTDCFSRREVTLHLPAADVPAGLPVAADCYTVNRAGLRCDRIIDVQVSGMIQSDFGWQ